MKVSYTTYLVNKILALNYPFVSERLLTSFYLLVDFKVILRVFKLEVR
jgi:hypothetical protein